MLLTRIEVKCWVSLFAYDVNILEKKNNCTTNSYIMKTIYY